jgi:hypothetical protein
MLRKG